MRLVLVMITLWAFACMPAALRAQSTVAAVDRADTTKKVTVDVHPQMLGGTASLRDRNGVLAFMASAAVLTKAPNHQGHLTFDLIQSAGTPHVAGCRGGL